MLVREGIKYSWIKDLRSFDIALKATVAVGCEFCHRPTRLRAVIFSLCFLSGCSGYSPADKPAPHAVEVATVTRGIGGESASYPARITYDREVTLSPRVSGIIRAMPIAVGQRLGSGALVLALDSTPYRAALARADAEAHRTARDAARDAELVSVGGIAEVDARDAADTAEAARATRTAAAYDFASGRIVMPFAGVVLAKSAEIGETVAPGQPVARVADLASRLIARVTVPALEARGMRLGRRASVNVGGRDYFGHVLRSGAAADPASGTVDVYVALSGSLPKSGIVSGVVGSARFAENEYDRASASGDQHIPAEALIDAHGAIGHVFIVDPRSGTARLTEVRLLGPGDDDWRVSGLPADARVITAGAGFVAHGQPVLVLTR